MKIKFAVAVRHFIRTTHRALVAVLFFISLTFSSAGAAMSIFFKGEEAEIVLFSELEGQLNYEGSPAAGAKLKLWIKWKDQEGETLQFTTDEEGRFKIPKQTAMHRDTALAQLVITQEIRVEYANTEFLIWTLSKNTGSEFNELGGKPQGFLCEITHELNTHRLDGVLMGTVCTWDSIEGTQG